jgi:phytoene/squalene synthetase
VHSPAYRAWVQSRVRLAREHFQAGRAYFAQVPSARCRLAAMAYTARFSWLLDTLEREDYVLRASYPERKSVGTGLRMGWLTLAALARGPAAGRRAPAVSGGLPKR